VVIKKKICSGCGQDRPAWKSNGRDKYCRKCWERLKGIPVKGRPKKTQEADQEYAALRKQFLSQYPWCRLRLPGCKGMATDVHHMQGRGGCYLDVSAWKPACRYCHAWCTENPAAAIAIGSSLPRNNEHHSSYIT
jgi:hypothetical protein